MTYKTEQEDFWAGKFGADYIDRNRSEMYLASNLYFFSKSLKQTGRPSSLIEFGANVGMNLKAIKSLFPGIKLHGVEINKTAAGELGEFLGEENVSNCSILEYDEKEKYDVVLIKGVLIHINPDELQNAYQQLYNASSNYILICEYYNPSPISIPYRGHDRKLFKRDFCGEMLDKFSDLRLIDYGFIYRRDVSFPQDDITWFLLQKF